MKQLLEIFNSCVLSPGLSLEHPAFLRRINKPVGSETKAEVGFHPCRKEGEFMILCNTS